MAIDGRFGGRSNSVITSVALKSFSKLIENAFSQIAHLFPLQIHAVTAEGFLLKLFLFLRAFTIRGWLDKGLSRNLN